MADWVSKRLDEIVEFNPRETIKKDVIAKKIAMDKLQPFCRDITEFELEPFLVVQNSETVTLLWQE